MALMEGLAFEKIVGSDEPAIERRLLKALKSIAPLASGSSMPETLPQGES